MGNADRLVWVAFKSGGWLTHPAPLDAVLASYGGDAVVFETREALGYYLAGSGGG